MEDDIAFGMENLNFERDEMLNRITEYSKKVEMFEYLKKEPHLLSGGQKQRVAIAGILAMDTDIIIFDEATAMLDPKGRQELMNLLVEIKKDNVRKKTTEQITIILITQFPDEALFADRLIVMEKGKIVFDDSPEIVFQNVDELKSIGLEVPVEFEILPILLEKGFDVANLFNENV